jgi:nucleoside-diphosphate-sugar epimerase
MRVLVTGGAGYIGNVLVTKLLSRGHEVRVLDRMFWGVPEYAGQPGVELVNADVRLMPAAVLDGIDAVDHLAGLSNDPTSEYNPDANWQMNALATERLARLCSAREIRRLVFGSSCSVYDGLDAGDTVLDESAPIVPRGAYALSKSWAEEALLREVGRGLEPVILRQATVFGASARMRFDLVVNSFVKDGLTHGRLTLHGGGGMWRPLISIEDLADIHVACLEAPSEAAAGEIFNAVQGNYQVRDLALCVAEALRQHGRPVTFTDGPLPSIVRSYRCSGSKLCRRLGIQPRVTPADGARDLAERFKNLSLEEMLDPTHYNIRWMELLERVRPAYYAMDTIFDPIKE